MPKTKEQTEQIRAESREKILSTARRLFAEKGYDGCNVSDIANAAGMSQGNIYWYFPSKNDIYGAILAEGFAELGAVMANAATGTGTAVEKLDAFLTNFLTLIKDQGGEEFVSIIMSLANRGGIQSISGFGLSTQQIGAGYHESLNLVFVQGQNEGAFLKDVDANTLSTFLFAFTNGLMIMYPDVWRDIPEEALRQAVHRLVGLTA
jgi:AcrR family transcriptional regulator